MVHTREEIISAIRAEIREWGATPPEFVTVPAPFLKDVLRLLEAEEDDGK